MKVSYLLWSTVMVADFVHSSATLRGTQGGEEKELADSFTSPSLPGESGAEPKSEQEDNGDDVDDANLNDAATVVDLGRLGQSFTDIYGLVSTINIDTNVKQDNGDDGSDPTANNVDAVVGQEGLGSSNKQVETEATSNGPDESPEPTQHVGEYLRQSFGAVIDDVPKAAPKQKERKLNNHNKHVTISFNSNDNYDRNLFVPKESSDLLPDKLLIEYGSGPPPTNCNVCGSDWECIGYSSPNPLRMFDYYLPSACEVIDAKATIYGTCWALGNSGVFDVAINGESLGKTPYAPYSTGCWCGDCYSTSVTSSEGFNKIQNGTNTIELLAESERASICVDRVELDFDMECGGNHTNRSLAQEGTLYSMMEEQSISGIEPFPLACDKDEPIPKIIIQTVKSMDDLDGLDWFKYHFSLKEQNSDYTFLIFDDIKALEFIDTFFQDSALPDLIRKVPRSVMKADLFRLAAVSVLGGFYMDMDMLAKESFDPIVHSGCGAVFPKEWWKDDDAFLERHFALPVDFEDHWQVGNYAFAALPNHPLVVDSLEEAIKRSIELIATKESADDITDLDVLRTTGPYMLSEVYHAGRKAGKYKDVMHIQGDDSKPLKEDQEYGFDWHKFGPYAEHMLSHTWVQPEEASE